MMGVWAMGFHPTILRQWWGAKSSRGGWLDFACWGFLGLWVIPLATSRLLGRVKGVFLWLCMR